MTVSALLIIIKIVFFNHYQGRYDIKFVYNGLQKCELKSTRYPYLNVYNGVLTHNICLYIYCWMLTCILIHTVYAYVKNALSFTYKPIKHIRYKLWNYSQAKSTVSQYLNINNNGASLHLSTNIVVLNICVLSQKPRYFYSTFESSEQVCKRIILDLFLIIYILLC